MIMRVWSIIKNTVLFPFYPLILLIQMFVERVQIFILRYKPYFPTLWYFFKPLVFSGAGLSVCLYLYIKFDFYFVFNDFNALNFLGTVVAFIALLIFIICIKRFVFPLWYIYKVFEHEREIGEKGRVIIYDGSPGAGKTLSMTYDMYYLACMSWSNLLFNYLRTYSDLRHGTAEFSSLDDVWCFDVQRDTVNYYLSNPNKIPLLVSNYPIKVGERFSSVLDWRAFVQKTRLPEGAAIAMDEYADKLSNQRSNAMLLKNEPELLAENLKIGETFSKERHFGDWYIGGAEQDQGEGLINLRRVVSINRNCKSCVKICSPVRLLNKVSNIRRSVLKRFAKDTPLEDCCKSRWVRKLKRLDRQIKRIGFFKVEFEDYNSSQKRRAILSGGYYCLPRNLPFAYATRAYQFEYEGFDYPLELETFMSLYMPVREQLPEPLPSDVELVKAADAARKLEKTRRDIAEWRDKFPHEFDSYAANNALPELPP